MMFSWQKINEMEEAEFVAVLGPVFEKSPWIAAAAAPLRPFATAAELLQAMIRQVEAAAPDKLLELLCAHPDLAARLDEVAALTPESQGEQRAAGLLALTPEEAGEIRRLLAAYRARFGFPFIICARLNNHGTILASLRQRMQLTPQEEKENAWLEVQKIASLRLRDLVASPDPES